MEGTGKQEMDALVDEILKSYEAHPETCSINTRNRISKDIIIDILEEIRSVVFPGYFEVKNLNAQSIEYHIGAASGGYSLPAAVSRWRRLCLNTKEKSIREEDAQLRAEEIVKAFLKRIPALREVLATDVQAAYDGDPAAFNTDEVIFSYPGVFAITVNRIAP